ncbi:MAG: hypothetical protein RLZZ338_2292 [Cyanobacteriota bacterium]
MKEEGRRKREEGRGKKEEGRRKKEEGRARSTVGAGSPLSFLHSLNTGKPAPNFSDIYRQFCTG